MDKDDRLEQSGLDFHTKVYEGYLKILEKESDRVISIDPSGTINETHQKIVNKLKEKGIF